MGCGSSNPENKEAIQISLLNNNSRELYTRSVPPDGKIGENQEINYNDKKDESGKDIENTLTNDLYNQGTLSSESDPEVEQYKKNKFIKAFSEIEPGTIQSLSFTSTQSKVSIHKPQDTQIFESNISKYIQYLDAVSSGVLSCINSIECKSKNSLIEVYN